MSVQSEKVKKWRATSKLRIIQSFGGGCGVCGYSKCPDALELHHLDPLQKDFGLGSVRATPKNWDLVVEELRKCILLCSNCHREYHYGLIRDVSKSPRFNEIYANYKKDQQLERQDQCPICNSLKSKKSKGCSVSCSSLLREKVKWPSTEELNQMVWSIPTTQIAKELGVSDKAISKRIKKLGLTKPPRGYWRKMAHKVGIEPTYTLQGPHR